ncbi:imidazolonepropionase [Paraferrimonas sedimenticola]|uniref:Imidazolonepropionase n=1 Tax=Paraferrimonas sedimenticola TaxID=375674 RepID=A0AA37VXU0_9GAMM|nr:imidazolonepropionase [Paraferrimonas sedimenticola]GLP95425.1 imidazolonepropionase [Paraferrimonas sedimenticola]
MNWQHLWIDVNLACMTEQADQPYGVIEDGAVAIEDGKIAWVGKRSELPEFDQHKVAIHRGNSGWMTPGLIDCHTHLVFGGDRAKEFEQRLQGVSYETIAKQGGGIRSTVAATRAADEQTLFDSGRKRLNALMREGVTQVEIKSGYGLDLENEVKQLQVARYLGEVHPIGVSTTCLAAHALPPEYADQPDAYVNLVCDSILPKVSELDLADAVDVFCEGIGFDLSQSEKVLRKAVELGLKPKMHAEQLSNLGGSALAAELGALSVDHIEFLDENGVKALAKSGTVAVLLPGAFYFLRETQLPPLDALREHGVPMAIASDFNPGSSPICSLKLMLNMACTLFSMTPEEALAGVTRHAAKALGLEQQMGQIKAGMQADLALWDIQHPSELSYSYGVNPLQALMIQGKLQQISAT